MTFSLACLGVVNESINLEIRNAQGLVLFTKTVIISEGVNAQVLVDLNGLADIGETCFLFRDGELVESFMIEEQRNVINDFALIEINLGRVDEMDFFVQEQENGFALKTENYKIHFANRKTRWRYNLIFQEKKDREITITEAGGKPVIFEVQTPRQLPNGQEATALLLTEPIGLVERYDDNFILEFIEDGISQKFSLPNADPNYLSVPDPEDNESYLSDIYVYI